MKKFFKLFLIIIILLISIIIYNNYFNHNNNVEVVKPLINIYPDTAYVGNPIFININSSSTPIESFLNNKKIEYIERNKSFLFIVPVDFNNKKTEYIFKSRLSNGMNIEKSIKINQRQKIVKKLDIPAKLGGNTKQASQNVLSNLAKENFELNNIKSENKTLWSSDFVYPLKDIFITDNYGYNRDTVGESIVHKGTDFRATTNTSVYAINDGIVKIAKKYTVYGNTIVIDHGKGIQTLYMHLNEMGVKIGDKVKIGQEIGKSGETGYALAPHLHLSIKINGISIDPVVFIKYFTAD